MELSLIVRRCGVVKHWGLLASFSAIFRPVAVALERAREVTMSAQRFAASYILRGKLKGWRGEGLWLCCLARDPSALPPFRKFLRAMGHQGQMARDVLQTARTVLTAVKALEEVVRNGWREVNAV